MPVVSASLSWMLLPSSTAAIIVVCVVGVVEVTQESTPQPELDDRA